MTALSASQQVLSPTSPQVQQQQQQQQQLPAPSSISTPSFIEQEQVPMHVEEQIEYLNSTYKHFQSCVLPAYPNCRIYLCGTIHVTQASVQFVKEGRSHKHH